MAKWIVVTGLDGSGKTNLVKNLAREYTERGLKVKTVHLPYDEHLRSEVLPLLKHTYSDRLLFALDNHIVGTMIETQWSCEYDVIISQRGYLDSFVHGSVQGYSYDEIGQINRIFALPVCDVMIHLCAAADEAYQRIMNDPDADKFEYPKYIRKQEHETRRAYAELLNGNPDLSAFSSCKNKFIDTTKISIEQTFQEAIEYLDSIDFMK